MLTCCRTPARSSSLPLTESLTLSCIVTGELLRTPSDLSLKRQVARALDGSKESRQILLLRLDERDALFLQTHCIIEQRTHVLLVRLISGGHLNSQLAPRLSLLHHQLILLRGEPRIRLRELGELRIGETEPLLRHPGGLLAESLLQRRAIRVCRRGHWLRLDCGCRNKQRESGKSETSSHHFDPWSRLSPLSTEIAGPGSVAGSASKLFMSSIS